MCFLLLFDVLLVFYALSSRTNIWTFFIELTKFFHKFEFTKKHFLTFLMIRPIFFETIHSRQWIRSGMHFSLIQIITQCAFSSNLSHAPRSKKLTQIWISSKPLWIEKSQLKSIMTSRRHLHINLSFGFTTVCLDPKYNQICGPRPPPPIFFCSNNYIFYIVTCLTFLLLAPFHGCLVNNWTCKL
jgi:hypothetical protein